MLFSEIYKIILVVIFISILISLASGVFFLIKDPSNSNRVARALTVRVILSVTLFLLLIYGFSAGLLKPHGLMLPTEVTQAQHLFENNSQLSARK